MPIIAIEGPDESGKTTLAQSLTNLLDGVVPVDYQRSPVKEHGWSKEYNTYLTRMSDLAHDRLIIQDRVPEISEAVYGNVLRGKSRSRGWAYELYRWINEPIFLIFCSGPYRLKSNHSDVQGNDIGPIEHQIVSAMYDHVCEQLANVVIWSHPHSFEVGMYWYGSKSWVSLFNQIRRWLIFRFPGYADELWDAFDVKEFPMPKEAR
jgi:hypothetical protein